jgi:hypothetical protein
LFAGAPNRLPLPPASTIAAAVAGGAGGPGGVPVGCTGAVHPGPPSAVKVRSPGERSPSRDRSAPKGDPYRSA